ncbi:MAG: methyltransferase [Alphaproteobacteria bacterium]|nr:methyltransferase [Alphaproteobacteria bacterium]
MNKPQTMNKSQTQPLTASNVLQSEYQRSIANYWNTNQNDPVNLLLGQVDGYYHHHYGIGDVDWSVLDAPESERNDRVIRELHRLEHAQALFLLDQLGDVKPGDKLMDAGSGRGGTSIMANERFGCQVEGVSISEYQVGFANQEAVKRGVADKVKFHFRNMLDSGFETGSMRSIWTNETTMYVDLFKLFSEFSRLLQQYICNIHPRSEYFKALAANSLVPIQVTDLTQQTIPYWELRAKSSVATGVEQPFLTAYKEGSFHYLMIVADRVIR